MLPSHLSLKSALEAHLDAVMHQARTLSPQEGLGEANPLSAARHLSLKKPA